MKFTVTPIPVSRLLLLSVLATMLSGCNYLTFFIPFDRFTPSEVAIKNRSKEPITVEFSTPRLDEPITIPLKPGGRWSSSRLPLEPEQHIAWAINRGQYKITVVENQDATFNGESLQSSPHRLWTRLHPRARFAYQDGRIVPLLRYPLINLGHEQLPAEEIRLEPIAPLTPPPSQAVLHR